MFEAYLISQVEQQGWSAGRRKQAMYCFYRVHCFKNFGGEDWMKILLALGHCSEEVILQANIVISQRRIRERTGRDAATHTQPDPILSTRTRQAMQGVPQRDLTPVRPPNTATPSQAKQARDHAKTFSKQITRTVYRKWGDALP